ncbi:MAG: yhdG 3, partial [Pseudonocardia sp.]|nr:yhdG 3 [Pseudonocardia sp.]
LTTVVMVLMLGQIRVLFAMSRDGLLPRPLARTGHGTPVGRRWSSELRSPWARPSCR